MIVKFEHYHDSWETYHDSTTVLNIIKSSVRLHCMCKYTIGTPCYMKELPKSKVGIISQVKLLSAPLVTSACLHPQYR